MALRNLMGRCPASTCTCRRIKLQLCQSADSPHRETKLELYPTAENVDPQP